MQQNLAMPALNQTEQRNLMAKTFRNRVLIGVHIGTKQIETQTGKKVTIDVMRPVREIVRTHSKYKPHQGKRECARRRRQMGIEP